MSRCLSKEWKSCQYIAAGSCDHQSSHYADGIREATIVSLEDGLFDPRRASLAGISLESL